MVKKNVFPALFDISQDIAGDVPVHLLREWIQSPKDRASALKVLEQTVVQGTSVSSDSAGLSKLSREKMLIEVLSLISEPKEIVYALGKAIGGEPIGIWAADNTQMFYPASVSIDDILSMLLETQHRIASCEVKIGMGAHYGIFYKIGGGLYGVEADFIEGVAEEDTRGGEIVISQQLLEQLKDPNRFSVIQREDLNHIEDKIYRLLEGPRIPHLQATDLRYPAPYSDAFIADMRQWLQTRDIDALNSLTARYVREKVVVLIERERIDEKDSEVELLNNLSYDVLMKKTAIFLLPQFKGEEIKTGSFLGIYVFDDEKEAFEFSREFRETLRVTGITCRIGIDSGGVIIFALQNGQKDIAGGPVNIASKMAQDYGTLGKIYMTDDVADALDVKKLHPFEMEISKVKIHGFVA